MTRSLVAATLLLFGIALFSQGIEHHNSWESAIGGGCLGIFTSLVIARQ